MILSVIITTYNQEVFVEETIKSALNQKTWFPFEIIIADDASKDHTPELIARVIKGKRNVIFLNNNKNLGVVRNYAQCLKIAKGKYVADLGGDDIWTDCYKLQKQVDFLEKYPEFGMVHTQYDIFLQDRGKTMRNYLKNPIYGNGQFENILIRNTICSVTACYRKDLIISMLDDFEAETFAYEDTPMWLEISMNSKIGYLKDATTLYRILDESISHSNCESRKRKYFQNVYNIINTFCNKYTVSKETLFAIEQERAIANCCFAFLGEDYLDFIKYYPVIINIPRRVRLMKVILKYKIFSSVFRPFKHWIYKQY